LWEALAYEGVPREKRHVKNTYASSTPATDGRHVVAFFGSQGLYAFDMGGKLLWKRDLGFLDVGAYDAPEFEWGTASSPIIYKNLVIVQCDTQKQDFLLALDIETGKTVWKADRDELPSWGTPTIYEGAKRTELVTNGSKFIRAYDPDTGKELWRLGGSSQITAPTPVWSGNLIVVASGRRPEAPIFVIRAGASGDITLAKGASSSAQVAWSRQQRGPYMPTPLIYGDRLYVLSNQGILDCYELGSGKEIYRQRIEHQGGGFSASPVAADGRIYLSSEDGDIFVVRAGATFELISSNPMGERLMATPALSDSRMFVRGERNLFAIGR
ncbi:MAG: bamB 2, partial [candidate division NC10 bacterium]|nr:bamB 2 [candidate division NC10 bacterium]